MCKNLPDDQHLEEGRDVEGSNAEAKGSNKSLQKEEYGRLKNDYSMAMKTSQETSETLQENLKTAQRQDEDFRGSTGRQGNRNTRGRQKEHYKNTIV